MTECNILIASGGRRPYLVRWFRAALERNGVVGNVVLADCDPFSPAGTFADRVVTAPLVGDAKYDWWLESLLSDEAIMLAISVNDYELSHWSRLPAENLAFDALIRLSARRQGMIEDKLATAQLLEGAGVSSPVTLPASDALKLTATELSELLETEDFVVKSRFGSGSKGLQFAGPDCLREAVTKARADVTDRDGMRPCHPEEIEDLIVVQPRIRGTEYGIDVVADLGGHHVGTLSRLKIRMRSGETDLAESTAIDPFMTTSERISAALGHRGLIDTDVIRDSAGHNWVIDINPRFGGGYPFSHMAGADVPAAYVAWALGRAHEDHWITCTPSVMAAKSVDVVPISKGFEYEAEGVLHSEGAPS